MKREARLLHVYVEPGCVVVVVYRGCRHMDWVYVSSSLEEAARAYLESSVKHEVRFCSRRWCQGLEERLTPVDAECGGFASLASSVCSEAKRLGLLNPH